MGTTAVLRLVFFVLLIGANFGEDYVEHTSTTVWLHGVLDGNLSFWYPKGDPTRIVFENPEKKKVDKRKVDLLKYENDLSDNHEIEVKENDGDSTFNFLQEMVPQREKKIRDLQEKKTEQEKRNELRLSAAARHGAAAVAHAREQMEQQRLRVELEKQRLDVQNALEEPVFAYVESRDYNYDDIEAGSTVVRGKDWKWGDQDGGILEGENGNPPKFQRGIVIEVTWWAGEVARDKYGVRVVWDATGIAGANIYRYGAEDARDIDIVGNRGASAAQKLLRDWHLEKAKLQLQPPPSPRGPKPVTASSASVQAATTKHERMKVDNNDHKEQDEYRFHENQCRQEEKDALLALFEALDGKNWKSKAGWLVKNSDPCFAGGAATAKFAEKNRGYIWTGILCEDSRIVAIDLSNNNLHGEISSNAFLSFGALKSLSLANNNITGKLPSSIGNLTNLQFLNLQNNNFSSFIPKEVGKLKKLEWFSLYNNRISGELPKEFGEISTLQSIFLQSNNLTGKIPTTFGEKPFLDGLRVFDIRQNRLSGSIPQGLIEKVKKDKGFKFNIQGNRELRLYSSDNDNKEEL